ncbi:Plasmodium vivax Vir protein, putative [Plasmodium vivax]|uniref:Vir protein, putative n=1 Tax=Plasmodium vivax TaxID=5855 RepID=A0A1G4EEX5_PLAVI|nr:Plasmodium vivax Vir protein, putative [Plasmodium vivax]
MVDKITDIEKWKTNYPFLKELWNSYDNFDKTVQYEENMNKYETLCDMILNRLNNDKEEHYNFFMKLVRNLGIYIEKDYSLNFKPDRCNNLNYWIYNSIKKHNIQDNLIDQCFENYFDVMNHAIVMIKCNYHSYDKIYEDPMIAIMLNIFKTYVGDVKNALMNRDASKHMLALKFVCDCVKIYKNERFKYCSYENLKNHKYQKTCDKFKSFKDTYTSFLFGQSDLIKKIPSLDNIDQEYSNMCGQFEGTTVKAIAPVASPSGEDNEDTADETSSPMTVVVENRNNPISSTVSTSLGAVAGASSVLALLYKFTPGGNWLRSGIGGNRRRINSNLYEDGPNELLFEGFEGRDMSFYNTRYNVGYGSV